MVVAETKSVCEQLISSRFSCRVNKVSSETIRQRVADYESLLQPILTILASGSYWGTRTHQKGWSETIEALANVYEDLELNSRGGSMALSNLQLYPPLLALYTAGFAAWLNEQYETLYQILRETTYVEFERSEALAHKLFYWKACHRDLWNQHVLGDERKYVPISEHMFEIVLKAVRPLTSKGKSSLEKSFDDFEYFCGLVEAYGSGDLIDQPDSTWEPIGQFIWRSGTRRYGEKKDEEFLRRYNNPSWAALNAGFFGGKQDHFKKTVNNFEAFCLKVRGELHVF